MRDAWPALLAALLVAGCGTAPSNGTPDGPGPDVAGDAAGTIGLPDWAVGDYWTYGFNGSPTSYVVSGETPTAWTMETDSEERSFANLRDDVSRLGPQRKSDLAGSQGDDAVEFFHWPLTAGAAWTTKWDHAPVAIEVKSVKEGKAELEARLANASASDPPLYRYGYDASVGWFSFLIHYAADGSELVNLKLSASGHAWKGTLVRWQLQTIFSDGGALPGPGASATYDVPLTATDVWVHGVLHCTSGVFNAGTSPFPFAGGITGQDDRGGGVVGEPCPSEQAWDGPVGAPKAMAQGGTTETWGYAVVGNPGSQGTWELEILVRTKELVPFGA